MSELLSPEQIIDGFKNKLVSDIIDTKIQTKSYGKTKKESIRIWIMVERKSFRKAIIHLKTLDFPHFLVCSGDDIGDNILINYHFSIYYGKKLKEIPMIIRTTLPKNDLTIPTITDLIPSATRSEREMQDMFGINVIGTPVDKPIFHPMYELEGERFFPWRRDEKGAQEKHIKRLYER